MVIDAARGIEARTLKLFEICRLRDIPIITFVNKMDRESRDPLDLLDEIERTLALHTAPMVWPIGRGRDFKGTYDLLQPRIRRVEQEPEGQPVSGPDDPALGALLDADATAAWRDEIALVQSACGKFDLAKFRDGTLTPVFFGSALKNFGVRDILEALIAHAPQPRNQKAATRLVEATERAMTGVIFKIQANMDPNHRDRIAFMRVCSGRLTRGMKVKVVRTEKTMALTAPQFFFAQDRSLAEEAYAGDVVGIPTAGHSRLATPSPRARTSRSWSSELRAGNPEADQARGRDPCQEAPRSAAGNGGRGRRPALQPTGRHAAHRRRHRRPAARCAGRSPLGRDGLQTGFDPAPGDTVRWITADDPAALSRFIEKNRSGIATDLDGAQVFLATSAFNLSWTAERNVEIKFVDIKTTTV